jgi:excisionase family DNA binding protein
VIDGKTYGNVFEIAKLLDVHWTRVYALLREGRLDAAKVMKEGRATWIRVDALKDYREAREFWIGLHTAKQTAAGGGR